MDYVGLQDDLYQMWERGWIALMYGDGDNQQRECLVVFLDECYSFRQYARSLVN